MAQQFLDSSYVVSLPEQLGGERVSEGGCDHGARESGHGRPAQVGPGGQALVVVLMIAYMGPFDDRRNGSTHGRRNGASQLIASMMRTARIRRRR